MNIRITNLFKICTGNVWCTLKTLEVVFLLMTVLVGLATFQKAHAEIELNVVNSQDTKTYPFPGRAEDLSFGAVWRVTNGHYDMHAVRFDEAAQKWTKLRPGANPNDLKLDDYLIYGVPVYAIASGEVYHCWRNAPENPIDVPHPGRDGCSDADDDGNNCDQHEDCSCSVPRSGNHIAILTDDGKKILHAHLQPDTVPEDICPHSEEFVADANFKDENGAIPEAWIPEGERPRVEKGDVLGLVGHSGASSGPHQHNHMTKDGNKILINYRNAWVQNYPGGSTNASLSNWEKLKGPLSWDPQQIILPNFSRGLKEIAYHFVPSSKYQFLFDHVTSSGYRLEWIDGFRVKGKIYFNVVFRPKNSVKHRYYHNLTGTQYQRKFNNAIEDGYRLVHVDSYEFGNATRYAAIFAKDGGPATAAYHGVSASTHQNKLEELKRRGFVPKVVSVVSHSGVRSYTGLYERSQSGSWRLRSFLTPAAYQAEYDTNKASGRKLAYVNAYNHNGRPRFVAIFKSRAPVVKKAKHGISSSGYQSHWNSAKANERKTQAVTGYVSGNGKVRFAAYWTN